MRRYVLRKLERGLVYVAAGLLWVADWLEEMRVVK